jgi:hypothetical protein
VFQKGFASHSRNRLKNKRPDFTLPVALSALAFQNCSDYVVAEATLLEGEQGEESRSGIRTDRGKKPLPLFADYALRDVSQGMPGCISSKSIVNSP